LKLGDLVKHNYEGPIYLGKGAIPWNEDEIGMVLEIDKFGPDRAIEGPFLTVLIPRGIGTVAMQEVEKV
jgi:hypothetical protein